MNKPDEARTRQILAEIFDCYQHLKSIGWREPNPRDERYSLLVIEAGSTGIFPGSLVKGEYYVYDGEDILESRPLLVFRQEKAEESQDAEEGNGA